MQTKDQTPLLPLSGTRKVVRTTTNPVETAVNAEMLSCTFQKKSLFEEFRKSLQESVRGKNLIITAVLLSGLGRLTTQERLYLKPIDNLYGPRATSQKLRTVAENRQQKA